jgi:hypothetical protein
MMKMAGFRYNNFPRPEYAESPLFERQIGDEYAELQQCRALLEQQHQRILKLEKINIDLESRLEEQAKQSNAVEAECIAIERKWSARCQSLEEEITQWKRECEKEKQRGGQLREQLSRTERELYVILQRSYELRRGGPAPGPAGNNPSSGGLPLGHGHGSSSGGHGHSASMNGMSMSKLLEQFTGKHGTETHHAASSSMSIIPKASASSLSGLYHVAEVSK